MAGRVVLVVALLIMDTLLQKSNLDLGALEIGRTGAYKSFYPDPIPTSTPYLASTMKATQKKSSSNGPRLRNVVFLGKALGRYGRPLIMLIHVIDKIHFEYVRDHISIGDELYCVSLSRQLHTQKELLLQKNRVLYHNTCHRDLLFTKSKYYLHIIIIIITPTYFMVCSAQPSLVATCFPARVP